MWCFTSEIVDAHVHLVGVVFLVAGKLHNVSKVVQRPIENATRHHSHHVVILSDQPHFSLVSSSHQSTPGIYSWHSINTVNVFDDCNDADD